MTDIEKTAVLDAIAELVDLTAEHGDKAFAGKVADVTKRLVIKLGLEKENDRMVEKKVMGHVIEMLLLGACARQLKKGDGNEESL